MITIRNLVKPSHENYKNIKRACRISSSVFNSANYIMRQEFFNGIIRKWSSVDKEVKLHNNTYNIIPSAASQSIIKGLYKSSVGKMLNADINGAINILRKVIGDDFVKKSNQ